MIAGSLMGCGEQPPQSGLPQEEDSGWESIEGGLPANESDAEELPIKEETETEESVVKEETEETETSGSAGDFEAVKERLAAYPDGFEEIATQTWDVCLLDADGRSVSGTGHLVDFLESVEDGTAAETVLAAFTKEGDPVYTHVSYNGEEFYVVEDYSRDKLRDQTGEGSDSGAYREKTFKELTDALPLERIDGFFPPQELTDSEKEQLRVFASNTEKWQFAGEDYGSYGGSYIVYDFDQDGRLELLATICVGTGLFTENHFYRVDESGNGMIELAQEAVPGPFAEHDGYDIGYQEMDAYQDGAGSYLYADSNVMKDGVTYYGTIEGLFWLDGDTVTFQDVRFMESLYKSATENHEIIYYDLDHNEISKEDWENLWTDCVMGMEARKVWFNRFSESEMEDWTEEAVYHALEQSYRYGVYY